MSSNKGQSGHNTQQPPTTQGTQGEQKSDKDRRGRSSSSSSSSSSSTNNSTSRSYSRSRSRDERKEEKQLDESFASFFNSFTGCGFYSYTDKNRDNNLTREKLTEMGYVDSTKLQAALAGHEVERDNGDDDGDGEAFAESTTTKAITSAYSSADLKDMLNPILTALTIAQGKLREKSKDTSQIDKWIRLISEYLNPDNPNEDLEVEENLKELQELLTNNKKHTGLKKKELKDMGFTNLVTATNKKSNAAPVSEDPGKAKASPQERRDPTVFMGYDGYKLDTLEPLCIQKENLIARFCWLKKRLKSKSSGAAARDEDPRIFSKRLERHFKENYSWLSSMLGYKTGGGENDDEHVTPFKFMIFFGGGIWKTPSLSLSSFFNQIVLTEEGYSNLLAAVAQGGGDTSVLNQLTPLKIVLLELMFSGNITKKIQFCRNLLLLMHGGIYLSEPLLNQEKSDTLPIKYDKATKKFEVSVSWCKTMSEDARAKAAATDVDAVKAAEETLDKYNRSNFEKNSTVIHGKKKFKIKQGVKGRYRLCTKACTECPVHKLYKSIRTDLPACIKCNQEKLEALILRFPEAVGDDDEKETAPKSKRRRSDPNSMIRELKQEIAAAEEDWIETMGITKMGDESDSNYKNRKIKWIKDNLSICMCAKKITIDDNIPAEERSMKCRCHSWHDQVYDTVMNRSNMRTILYELCKELNKFTYERAFYNSVLLFGAKKQGKIQTHAAQHIRVGAVEMLRTVAAQQSPASQRATAAPAPASQGFGSPGRGFSSQSAAADDDDDTDNCHVKFIEKYVHEYDLLNKLLVMRERVEEELKQLAEAFGTSSLMSPESKKEILQKQLVGITELIDIFVKGKILHEAFMKGGIKVKRNKKQKKKTKRKMKRKQRKRTRRKR